MLIFNEHMRLIKDMPIKNRMVQLAVFHEDQSQIITAGIDGVFINNIKIMSKYEAKQSIMLDPDGKNIQFDMVRAQQLPCMTEWVKGLKIDTHNNLITAWDQYTVCFYQLKDQFDVKQGTMLRKIEDLSNKENFVSDLIVYSDFQTFITGS
jgi:hypothetical protein